MMVSGIYVFLPESLIISSFHSHVRDSRHELQICGFTFTDLIMLIGELDVSELWAGYKIGEKRNHH